MSRMIRTAGLAMGPALLMTSPVMAGEYQCRQDDSAVRIAIEVKKRGHTLPCEVIAEDDRNERAVLYSAQYDREYCPNRLEKTRAELESEGWTCQKTADTNVVQGEGQLLPLNELSASESEVAEAPVAEAPKAVAVSDGRLQCRLDDKLRRLEIEVDDPDKGKPCSLIYWSEDNSSEEGQVLWRAEHDAEFCPKRMGIIVQKWASEGWQCSADGKGETVETAALPAEDAPSAPVQDTVTEAAETPAVPTPEEPADQPEEPTEIDPNLKAIIEADAKRIGEWMEVEPGVEVAAYGDLNADGKEDAVIFLAYQSEQAAYRQYLMSYLLADETYELAGVKLLTGVSPPPGQAKVEEIDKGVIWLSIAKDNGTRADPVGYELRNQQLVEVDTSQQAQSASN